MCNVQITQQFRWLGTLLIMILHVWPVNQPTIINNKNLDTPALENDQKMAGIT
jgi:hypothetical protein